MGYGVTTTGQLILDFTFNPADVWNAYAAAIAANTHREHTPIAVASWDDVVGNLEYSFQRVGLLISYAGEITYNATRRNTWALIVMRALVPFCHDGCFIEFLGEDGDCWREYAFQGRLVDCIEFDGAWSETKPYAGDL